MKCYDSGEISLHFQKLPNTSEYRKEEKSDGGTGGDGSCAADGPVWVNAQF